MTRHIPRFIPLTLMAAIALASSLSFAGPLPPLIDFQSVLLDEGGNLLPSGSTSVQFQILDENRAPIYTETQFVDVVKGAASALIGNGTDAKGISTGGLPEDLFATGAPRYLEVQVDGHAAEDPMTIVPVPYAQWSQTCATVADGGVTPASIARAAVGFESLAPDVVAKLAEEMSKSQGVLTAQSLGGSGGATQIGLEAKLINSGSSSVQGALQDIDLAVKKRQEETTFLTGKVNEEVTNRTNAVNDEVKNRTDAVAGVQVKLDQEVTNRSTAVSSEQQTRTAADNVLQGQITKEIIDRNAAVSSEQQTRTAADNVLLGQITKEIIDRNTAVSSEQQTRTAADGVFTQTLTDINNIPGKLTIDRLEPNSSAASDLNMGEKKITNLGEPTADKDAATMKYVKDMTTSIINQNNSAMVGTAKIATGGYKGTGNTPQTINTPGLRPRVIYIFGPSACNWWTMGTDADLSGNTITGIWFNCSTGSVAVGSDGIQQIFSGGFKVFGQGNSSDAQYYFIAIGEKS